jgi:hypothetical protein
MAKKIGILRGREDNFPNALAEIVARKTQGRIEVEQVVVGAERLRKRWDYDLILDRISHDYPYYRYLLKSAVLEGTYVIPNPLQASADDKLLGFNLADRLGIPVPRTVTLPIAGSGMLYDISAQSLRNLRFLGQRDWEEVFEYIGFPGWLKPASGGGWLAVTKVRSPDEFWYNYNHALHHERRLGLESESDDLAVRRWLSRTLIFLFQQDIAYQKFARCWYLAGEVITARFVPPDRVAGQRLGRYENDPEFFGRDTLEMLDRYVRAINETLGYEINTVEFLIKDDVPYAIDFLNCTCDMDVGSIGPYFADLTIGKVADYLIRCVDDPSARLQHRNRLWAGLLTGRVP